MRWLDVCCVRLHTRDYIITKAYFILNDGDVFLWWWCGAKGKNQADKFHYYHNSDRCWRCLRVCMVAPLWSIKVSFPYQDSFLSPFDVHGCNHVEYPVEAEAIETRLEGFHQYPIVYEQAWRAREKVVVGDVSFSVALSFLIYWEFCCYLNRDKSHIFDVLGWVDCEGQCPSMVYLFVCYFFLRFHVKF